MLVRKQDLGVLLFYFMGYSRIRNLAFRLQHKSLARFIVFHDVLPSMLNQFEAHLRFLKRRTNVISLKDYFLGRLSSNKLNVVITFDDGYKSWVSSAIPMLKKFELPATFFISSGFVGLTHEEELAFLKTRMYQMLGPRETSGGLSLGDVRMIADEGFTVGGHTTNHSVLSDLTDINQLRDDIVNDKIKLERITGNHIDYFAYPSGVYHNPKIDITKVLRDVGYMGALTTKSGFNDQKTCPYLLHRELTDVSMPQRVFRARVQGNYDAVQYFKNSLGTSLSIRRE